MERVGRIESGGSLASFSPLEVIPEEFAVHRVSTILNDCLGTLYGILGAKVGDTLVGDEDIYRMLRMVVVGNVRHDIAYQPTLGDRRASEYRQIAVAGEVARTADTVHHPCAKHMGGVHVTEDVGFKGGVHCYHAESADDFGIVGNLSRAQNDFVMEEIHVGEQLALDLVGEGHRAGAGECAFAVAEQFEDGILHNLGVHHEVGEFLVEAEVVEDGIGHVAHAALEGKELFGNPALAVFRNEEVNDIDSDMFRNLVRLGERLHPVKRIGAHDADNL